MSKEGCSANFLKKVNLLKNELKKSYLTYSNCHSVLYSQFGFAHGEKIINAVTLNVSAVQELLVKVFIC